jgi:hypothetical protein
MEPMDRRSRESTRCSGRVMPSFAAFSALFLPTSCPTITVEAEITNTVAQAIRDGIGIRFLVAIESPIFPNAERRAPGREPSSLQ